METKNKKLVSAFKKAGTKNKKAETENYFP